MISFLHKSKYTIALLIFLILQVLSADLQQLFLFDLNRLNSGDALALKASLSILLSVGSGIVCIFLFFPGQSEDSLRRKRPVIIVLSIIMTGTILMKVLIAFYGVGIYPFSPLQRGGRQLFEWMVFSDFPSFSLGLCVGWLLCQTACNPKRKNECG